MPRRRGAPSVAKHEDNRHARSSRRRAPRRGPSGAGKPTRPGVTAPPKPGRASPATPGVTAPPKPGRASPATPGVTAPPKPGRASPATPGVTAPPNPGGASPATPGRHDVGMRDVGDLPLDGAAERAVPSGESARRAETAFADQVDA